MKNLIIAALSAFFVLVSNAKAAPIIVLNGGGVGEFYLFYSLRTMPTLIDLCRAQAVCDAGIDSKLETLSQAKPYDGLILNVVSTAEMGPSLFTLADAHHLSVNKDLLFTQVNGRSEPWLYPDVVAFYINVWAHQLGWSPSDAAQIGARLAGMASVKSDRFAQSEIDMKQYSLVLFEQPFSSVVIEDDSRAAAATTLEVPFLTLVDCQASSGDAIPLKELRVVSTGWGATDNHLASTRLLQVNGLMQYSCGSTRFSSRYHFTIRASLSDTVWVLDPSSASIEQNAIQELP